MKITISPGGVPYDVITERGCLYKASRLLDLDRRVMIVTDDGVPDEYPDALARQCAQPFIFTARQGERSKSFDTLEQLLSCMLEGGFTREDCVAAVGGGVAGDLAGFAAAVYMRGVDFYNIPTTVLSQVDSSVGGKTAINLAGIKNTVGAFYQPKRVLIDPDMLSTLPARQVSNGLAEALKMSLTCDAELFSLFESGAAAGELEHVIARSVAIKADIVTRDEKESGLRRVLNFGHTIGHAIESAGYGLCHGECVALGMLPMCSQSVRERLLPVLRALSLPTSLELDEKRIMRALTHDKKTRTDGRISIITVERPGEYETSLVTPEDIRSRLGVITKGAENI